MGGIGIRPHVATCAQRVDGGAVLEEILGDHLEPVGIGAEGQARGFEGFHGCGHRLWGGAVGEDGLGPHVRSHLASVRGGFARAQKASVAVHHGDREPDGQVCRPGAFEDGTGMGEACDGFAQDQVDMGGEEARDFGIFGHGLGMGRMRLRPIGGDEWTDAAGNQSAPRMSARRVGLGQRGGMKRGEAILDPCPDEPIAMDGIGVGRGDAGPGVEIVPVDGFHQTGMVDHHLRRPERRRPVASAADQFLSHAAIEERDFRHRVAFHFLS